MLSFEERVMDDLPFSRIWMENKLGLQRKATDTSKQIVLSYNAMLKLLIISPLNGHPINFHKVTVMRSVFDQSLEINLMKEVRNH